jgi:hypothetical protein
MLICVLMVWLVCLAQFGAKLVQERDVGSSSPHSSKDPTPQPLALDASITSGTALGKKSSKLSVLSQGSSLVSSSGLPEPLDSSGTHSRISEGRAVLA